MSVPTTWFNMLASWTEQFTVTYSTVNKAHGEMSIHIIILISLSNISFGICATIPSNKNSPALLVVSYDGFRPDYLNCNDTPNLNKFRENGTSAAFMMNVFPTKTIVNHFTIATVSSKTIQYFCCECKRFRRLNSLDYNLKRRVCTQKTME